MLRSNISLTCTPPKVLNTMESLPGRLFLEWFVWRTNMPVRHVVCSVFVSGSRSLDPEWFQGLLQPLDVWLERDSSSSSLDSPGVRNEETECIRGTQNLVAFHH